MKNILDFKGWKEVNEMSHPDPSWDSENSREEDSLYSAHSWKKGFSRLCADVFDEDPKAVKEMLEELGYSQSDFEQVGMLYSENPTVFQDGVPFPGDDEIWDMMLEMDPRAQLLQKMIDDIE